MLLLEGCSGFFVEVGQFAWACFMCETFQLKAESYALGARHVLTWRYKAIT